tara:strand:- start:57 stop:983 length:927 start_codon:yes stop_codon:yes gene_type:complete
MNDINLDRLVEMFVEAGTPVNERKNKPEPIIYQPITMDTRWFNNFEDATSDQNKIRFESAIANLAPGSIMQLDVFVRDMNSFLQSEPDLDDHVASIARIDILRTLLNLVTGPNGGVQGYHFENFMAGLFNGTVISDTKNNLADVDFDSGRVSLKLIDPKDGRIYGSWGNLQLEMMRDGPLTYYVGYKYPEEQKVIFKRFVITPDAYRLLEPKIKDGTFVINKTMLKNDREFELQEVGELDLSMAESRTEQLFAGLDKKFNRLFSSLQELNDAANRFKTESESMGKDKSKLKSATTRKATKTKKASQSI